MLHTVEIRRIGGDLARDLAEMRGWLDRHGLDVAEFQHSFGGPGITFRVSFHAADEAAAFAEHFDGWINGRDPHGASLWRIGRVVR